MAAVTIDKFVPIADRYKVFLRLFSELYSLNLSEREIDILNEFCLHEGGVINQASRIRVSEKLKMTNFNLTNYLRKLRQKNVASSKSLNEKLIINIMPADKVFSVIFNFNSENAAKG